MEASRQNLRNGDIISLSTSVGTDLGGLFLCRARPDWVQCCQRPAHPEESCLWTVTALYRDPHDELRYGDEVIFMHLYSGLYLPSNVDASSTMGERMRLVGDRSIASFRLMPPANRFLGLRHKIRRTNGFVWLQAPGADLNSYSLQVDEKNGKYVLLRHHLDTAGSHSTIVESHSIWQLRVFRTAAHNHAEFLHPGDVFRLSYMGLEEVKTLSMVSAGSSNLRDSEAFKLLQSFRAFDDSANYLLQLRFKDNNRNPLSMWQIDCPLTSEDVESRWIREDHSFVYEFRIVNKISGLFLQVMNRDADFNLTCHRNKASIFKFLSVAPYHDHDSRFIKNESAGHLGVKLNGVWYWCIHSRDPNNPTLKLVAAEGARVPWKDVFVIDRANLSDIEGFYDVWYMQQELLDFKNKYLQPNHLIGPFSDFTSSDPQAVAKAVYTLLSRINHLKFNLDRLARTCTYDPENEQNTSNRRGEAIQDQQYLMNNLYVISSVARLMQRSNQVRKELATEVLSRAGNDRELLEVASRLALEVGMRYNKDISFRRAVDKMLELDSKMDPSMKWILQRSGYGRISELKYSSKTRFFEWQGDQKPFRTYHTYVTKALSGIEEFQCSMLAFLRLSMWRNRRVKVQIISMELKEGKKHKTVLQYLWDWLRVEGAPKERNLAFQQHQEVSYSHTPSYPVANHIVQLIRYSYKNNMPKLLEPGPRSDSKAASEPRWVWEVDRLFRRNFEVIWNVAPDFLAVFVEHRDLPIESNQHAAFRRFFSPSSALVRDGYARLCPRIAADFSKKRNIEIKICKPVGSKYGKRFDKDSTLGHKYILAKTTSISVSGRKLTKIPQLDSTVEPLTYESKGFNSNLMATSPHLRKTGSPSVSGSNSLRPSPQESPRNGDKSIRLKDFKNNGNDFELDSTNNVRRDILTSKPRARRNSPKRPTKNSTRNLQRIDSGRSLNGRSFPRLQRMESNNSLQSRNYATHRHYDYGHGMESHFTVSLSDYVSLKEWVEPFMIKDAKEEKNTPPSLLRQQSSESQDVNYVNSRKLQSLEYFRGCLWLAKAVCIGNRDNILSMRALLSLKDLKLTYDMLGGWTKAVLRLKRNVIEAIRILYVQPNLTCLSFLGEQDIQRDVDNFVEQIIELGEKILQFPQDPSKAHWAAVVRRYELRIVQHCVRHRARRHVNLLLRKEHAAGNIPAVYQQLYEVVEILKDFDRFSACSTEEWVALENILDDLQIRLRVAMKTPENKYMDSKVNDSADVRILQILQVSMSALDIQDQIINIFNLSFQNDYLDDGNDSYGPSYVAELANLGRVVSFQGPIDFAAKKRKFRLNTVRKSTALALRLKQEKAVVVQRAITHCLRVLFIFIGLKSAYDRPHLSEKPKLKSVGNIGKLENPRFLRASMRILKFCTPRTHWNPTPWQYNTANRIADCMLTVGREHPTFFRMFQPPDVVVIFKAFNSLRLFRSAEYHTCELFMCLLRRIMSPKSGVELPNRDAQMMTFQLLEESGILGLEDEVTRGSVTVSTSAILDDTKAREASPGIDLSGENGRQLQLARSARRRPSRTKDMLSSATPETKDSNDFDRKIHNPSPLDQMSSQSPEPRGRTIDFKLEARRASESKMTASESKMTVSEPGGEAGSESRIGREGSSSQSRIFPIAPNIAVASASIAQRRSRSRADGPAGRRRGKSTSPARRKSSIFLDELPRDDNILWMNSARRGSLKMRERHRRGSIVSSRRASLNALGMVQVIQSIFSRPRGLYDSINVFVEGMKAEEAMRAEIANKEKSRSEIVESKGSPPGTFQQANMKWILSASSVRNIILSRSRGNTTQDNRSSDVKYEYPEGDAKAKINVKATLWQRVFCCLNESYNRITAEKAVVVPNIDPGDFVERFPEKWRRSLNSALAIRVSEKQQKNPDFMRCKASVYSTLATVNRIIFESRISGRYKRQLLNAFNQFRENPKNRSRLWRRSNLRRVYHSGDRLISLTPGLWESRLNLVMAHFQPGGTARSSLLWKNGDEQFSLPKMGEYKEISPKAELSYSPGSLNVEAFHFIKLAGIVLQGRFSRAEARLRSILSAEEIVSALKASVVTTAEEEVSIAPGEEDRLMEHNRSVYRVRQALLRLLQNMYINVSRPMQIRHHVRSMFSLFAREWRQFDFLKWSRESRRNAQGRTDLEVQRWQYVFQLHRYCKFSLNTNDLKDVKVAARRLFRQEGLEQDAQEFEDKQKRKHSKKPSEAEYNVGRQQEQVSNFEQFVKRRGIRKVSTDLIRHLNRTIPDYSKENLTPLVKAFSLSTWVDWGFEMLLNAVSLAVFLVFSTMTLEMLLLTTCVFFGVKIGVRVTKALSGGLGGHILIQTFFLPIGAVILAATSLITIVYGPVRTHFNLIISAGVMGHIHNDDMVSNDESQGVGYCREEIKFERGRIYCKKCTLSHIKPGFVIYENSVLEARKSIVQNLISRSSKTPGHSEARFKDKLAFAEVLNELELREEDTDIRRTINIDRGTNSRKMSITSDLVAMRKQFSLVLAKKRVAEKNKRAHEGTRKKDPYGELLRMFHSVFEQIKANKGPVAIMLYQIVIEMIKDFKLMDDTRPLKGIFSYKREPFANAKFCAMYLLMAKEFKFAELSIHMIVSSFDIDGRKSRKGTMTSRGLRLANFLLNTGDVQIQREFLELMKQDEENKVLAVLEDILKDFKREVKIHKEQSSLNLRHDPDEVHMVELAIGFLFRLCMGGNATGASDYVCNRYGNRDHNLVSEIAWFISEMHTDLIYLVLDHNMPKQASTMLQLLRNGLRFLTDVCYGPNEYIQNLIGTTPHLISSCFDLLWMILEKYRRLDRKVSPGTARVRPILQDVEMHILKLLRAVLDGQNQCTMQWQASILNNARSVVVGTEKAPIDIINELLRLHCRKYLRMLADYQQNESKDLRMQFMSSMKHVELIVELWGYLTTLAEGVERSRAKTIFAVLTKWEKWADQRWHAREIPKHFHLSQILMQCEVHLHNGKQERLFFVKPWFFTLDSEGSTSTLKNLIRDRCVQEKRHEKRIVDLMRRSHALWKIAEFHYITFPRAIKTFRLNEAIEKDALGALQFLKDHFNRIWRATYSMVIIINALVIAWATTETSDGDFFQFRIRTTQCRLRMSGSQLVGNENDCDGFQYIFPALSVIHMGLGSLMIASYFFSRGIAEYHAEAANRRRLEQADNPSGWRIYASEPSFSNISNRRSEAEGNDLDVRQTFWENANRTIRLVVRVARVALRIHAVKYYLIYVICAILAVVNTPIWTAFHLIDIATYLTSLKDILYVTNRHKGRLLATVTLGLIFAYFFTVLIFVFFPEDVRFDVDDDLVYSCGTLWSCVEKAVDLSFRNTPVFVQNPIPVISPTFDLVHFLLFTILVSIITGIIIDTFAEMRENRDKIELEVTTKCFICHKGYQDFDESKQHSGFQHHLTVEHNMWAYVYMKFYILRKAVRSPNKLSNVELYVAKVLLEGDSKIWRIIPNNKTLHLKEHDDLTGTSDTSVSGHDRVAKSNPLPGIPRRNSHVPLHEEDDMSIDSKSRSKV
ncbi:hypothetical protein AAMO2058_000283300 [Amorphochlora amoebiformis]